MNPIVVTVIVSTIICVILPALMRLPNNRKRIRKVDTRKLIELNKRSGHMRWVMLAMAFVGPQPFFLLLALLRDPRITTPLLCMMVIVMFSGFLGFSMFTEIHIQGEAELEFRYREQKTLSGSE